MKNIYEKFKKIISDKPKLFRYFTSLILIIFCISYMGNVLNNQDVLDPANPIKGFAKNSSQVALASQDEPLVEIEEINDENAEKETEDKNTQDNKKGAENNENEGDNEEGDGESDENNPESSNVEILNPEDANKNNDKSKINEYFTTSIIHNEIVTEKEYSFIIKQKNPNLKVKKTEIFLNDILVPEFKGTVILDEGKNSIKVKVTYEDVDGKIFSVSKTYSVHLNTEDIIIYSSLNEEMKVTKDKLSFTAWAKKGEKTLPIDVKLNEQKVKGENGNRYNVTLNEGENKVIVSASDDSGNTEEKSFLIIYEKKDTKLRIITNLKEQHVTTDEIKFNAIAKFGEDKAKLTVENNGTLISGDDKGNYAANLIEGPNYILLKAEYGDETLIEEYRIQYEVLPPGGEDGDLEDPNNPKIETNLKDGITVKSSIYDIYVIARDHKGNRIHPSQMQVKCNGELIGIHWEDGVQTSYKLPIRNGGNTIMISAYDSEGKITIENFHIKGIVKDKGEVTGHATISIEATTIGLGYIVPPTKVEIREGKPASTVIDKLLKEKGFEYESQGKIDNAFYLAHLIKPGLVSNPVIPEDLAELVEAEADRFSPDDYNQDSLGEYDFSNGSGWMYSVNGHYPNYGFSDCYLLDGDVMRIRFTLFYGRDIGGSGGLGGSGSNWHKEW
ncbi:MAG: DUF4430 domain-containing protein [Clostridiaceae bacterium]|nr:DUF4430 domain-containing protein [Clostridiaceae bacterium]MBW4859951.1 DUF4430 domain-containing protein [Clostridiaceae bacterium]MBW4869335.1 DUF4430 domain-containing protein [Clostridiaceae bacterium]